MFGRKKAAVREFNPDLRLIYHFAHKMWYINCKDVNVIHQERTVKK